MSKELVSLTQLLKYILFCAENVQNYKLSPQKINRVYNHLDPHKKGFVTVTDFFNFFSGFTKESLFHIFKFLNYSQSGTISLEDLINTLSYCDPTKNMSDRDPLTAFKFVIKMLELNHGMIESKKQELNLSKQNLRIVFKEIKEKGKNQENNIEAKEVISIMEQYHYQLSQIGRSFIMESIFHERDMNVEQFVDYFKCFSWEDILEQATQPKNQQVPQIIKDGKEPKKFEFQPNVGPIFQNSKILESHQNYLSRGSLERQKIIKEALDQDKNSELAHLNSFYEGLNNIPSTYNSAYNFYSQPFYDRLTDKQLFNTQYNTLSGGFGVSGTPQEWLTFSRPQDSVLKRVGFENRKCMDKENIIRRAQLQANRKIQQIQENVRIKLQQRRRCLF